MHRKAKRENDSMSQVIEPRVWVQPQAEASPAFRSRGRRELFSAVQSTPSPVAYQRNQKLVCENGNGLGHRQERVFGLPANDNPGPGAYEIRGKLGKRAKSALPRAVEETKTGTAWVPGPGQYNVAGNALKADGRKDSAFMSVAKREIEKPMFNPAPGSYETAGGTSVGKILPLIHESRTDKVNDWIDHSKGEIPAPDSYQSVKMGPGRGQTISKLGRDVGTSNEVPGPGSYEVVHGAIGTRSRNACASQAGSELMK
jgi:hypothetical protein